METHSAMRTTNPGALGPRDQGDRVHEPGRLLFSQAHGNRQCWATSAAAKEIGGLF